jgi:class 3 adenylate cyclase
MLMETDVRDALPLIQVPTLVIGRTGVTMVPPAHAQYLAEHIPDSKLVELPGEDYLPAFGDVEPILDEIRAFVTGRRSAPAGDRVLATVPFTDIVQSTRRAAELGDRQWRVLLASHHAAVRRELQEFRGREVDTAGDGFLATFDGPGRAIRCAAAIQDSVRALGLDIRAGLHTGEIEVEDDGVTGIAVHIGARVAALAGPSEILVTSTVKDLVVGSEIKFEDRGAQPLKGVPGEWHIYAVTG